MALAHAVKKENERLEAYRRSRIPRVHFPKKSVIIF